MHEAALRVHMRKAVCQRLAVVFVAVATILSCSESIDVSARPDSQDVLFSGDTRGNTLSTALGPVHGLRALLCASACGDSVILSFEGLVDGIDTLSAQYADDGVVFDGALIVNAPHYNSALYPPHSGVTIALSNVFRPTNTITFTLAEDAVLVRGFFTATSAVTLTCFDAANQQLGSASFPGGNLGHTGLSNQPLQVASAGIRSCTLTGPAGQYSLDDLTVKWRESVAPELKLTCNSTTLVRADSINCVASVIPPGTAMQITKWTYAPVGLAVVDRSDEPGSNVSSTIWAGRLVTSGTMRVEALVGGVTLSAQQGITIQPRDWSTQTITTTIVDSGSTGLPAIPTQDRELGFNRIYSNATMALIGPGPNYSFVYYPDMSVRTRFVIYINTVALTPGSAFLAGIEQDRKTVGDTVYCGRAEVGALEPKVREHEGLVAGAPVSHVKIYLDTLVKSVRSELESFASTDLASGPMLVDQMLLKALTATERLDTKGYPGNPLTLTCAINYRRGPEPPGQ